MDRHDVIGLSSMATRGVLADLAGRVSADGPADVVFSSAGGVEVGRRVREGEVADLLVLARGAVEALVEQGHLVAATVRPLFLSEVVVAVPEGAPAPEIASIEQLQAALVGAGRIGYSTGPSGAALLRLLDEWGLRAQLEDHLVQAPAGVPVAQLLAQGGADLGFQQRSELTGIPGVRVLGPMPPGAEIVTTFTGAVLTRTGDESVARGVLEALAAPAHGPVVAEHGMTLAGERRV